jgi:hypothetical protein
MLCAHTSYCLYALLLLLCVVDCVSAMHQYCVRKRFGGDMHGGLAQVSKLMRTQEYCYGFES